MRLESVEGKAFAGMAAVGLVQQFIHVKQNMPSKTPGSIQTPFLGGDQQSAMCAPGLGRAFVVRFLGFLGGEAGEGGLGRESFGWGIGCISFLHGDGWLVRPTRVTFGKSPKVTKGLLPNHSDLA